MTDQELRFEYLCKLGAGIVLALLKPGHDARNG